MKEGDQLIPISSAENCKVAQCSINANVYIKDGKSTCALIDNLIGHPDEETADRLRCYIQEEFHLCDCLFFDNLCKQYGVDS